MIRSIKQKFEEHSFVAYQKFNKTSSMDNNKKKNHRMKLKFTVNSIIINKLNQHRELINNWLIVEKQFHNYKREITQEDKFS